MPAAKDLTGQVFGKLTVLELGPPKKNCRTWKCRCQCGKDVIRSQPSLSKGKTKSCGCNSKSPRPFKENTKKSTVRQARHALGLTQEQFGRLLGVSKAAITSLESRDGYRYRDVVDRYNRVAPPEYRMDNAWVQDKGGKNQKARPSLCATCKCIHYHRTGKLGLYCSKRCKAISENNKRCGHLAAYFLCSCGKSSRRKPCYVRLHMFCSEACGYAAKKVGIKSLPPTRLITADQHAAITALWARPQGPPTPAEIEHVLNPSPETKREKRDKWTGMERALQQQQQV